MKETNPNVENWDPGGQKLEDLAITENVCPSKAKVTRNKKLFLSNFLRSPSSVEARVV